MMKHLRRIIAAAALMLCGTAAFAEYSMGYYNFPDARKLENNQVAVEGEWDFFWGKFVPADDLYTEPDCQVKLPSMWNYYDLNKEAAAIAATGKGCGTYRITLAGLKPNTSYGFHTYNFASTAFEAYCEDQLIYKCGEVNEDWTKTKSESTMDIASFMTNEAGCATITIFVSNDFYRKGGLWDSFRIQEEKSIYTWYNRKVCQFSLLLGVLLTVVLYGFLVAYLRKDIAYLYLSLYVFAIFLRILCSEFPLLKHAFPGIPYTFMLRMEYVALYTAPAFYTLYVDSLDKEIFGKIKAWGFCVPALVLFVINFLIPIYATNRMVPLMQIYLFFLLIVNFIFVFASLIKKHSTTSIFTMVTILIIGLGCLNDVLSASENFIFANVRILNICFVIYAFCQTAFLAYVQNRNQNKVTAINEDLSKSNTTFNKFVPSELISYISDKSATDVEAGEFKEENMGILCCDIRGFSRVRKELKDDQVFNVLNEFFQKIAPVVRKHNGMIEKYVGDGLLALFPSGAEDAINCALEIQFRLRELRDDFRSMGLPPLKAGIGVHYGNVLAGIAGDEFRISEVVVSNNMYVVKQTEDLTKSFKKSIVVTREAVKNASDTARIKGHKFDFSGVRLATTSGQLYYAIYNDKIPAEL